MQKHWLKIAAVAVVLVGAAAFFWQAPSEGPVALMVNPTHGPFKVTVTATGELQAKNSVRIYGPSGARQARIYELKILRLIPEGTVVSKGDFVAELDRSELNTNIQNASLDLQTAQSLYTQTKLDTTMTLSQARDELVNLRYAMEEALLRKEQAAFEPPSVQRQEEINYEKAERAYDQAVSNYDTQVQQEIAKMQEVEAELAKAQNSYDQLVTLASDFSILAPESGMLIYKRDWRGNRITEGGTINSWDPVVATLPDLSVMESITYVNEVDIQKIKVGQPVNISLDADADKKLSGRVTTIANIGEQRPNSDAKVFEVGIVVNESDSTLRPAMTTSNTIIVADVPEALSIPLETIHTADSLNFVYLKDGLKIVRQEVRLGLINENEAIVEAGLTEADALYLSTPALAEEPELRRLSASETLAEERPARP